MNMANNNLRISVYILITLRFPDGSDLQQKLEI